MPMKIENLTLANEDLHGDDHVGSSAQTPLREDAFDLSDEQKIELNQEKVSLRLYLSISEFRQIIMREISISFQIKLHILLVILKRKGVML